MNFDNQLHLPSTEDIKRTLTSFTDFQVSCCVDYFPKNKSGQSHFYTYPYTMVLYNGITNNFLGGFFIRISDAFPLLKELTISNLEPQNEKLNEDGRHFPIIKYPCLTVLRFIDIHEDYAEQFLLDQKTCLSNFIRLVLDYGQLDSVILIILQEMRHESIVVKSNNFILTIDLIYRNIFMFTSIISIIIRVL